MKAFQRILAECLTRLSNGSATVDECLSLYPKHAEQLKPLLQTVVLLDRGRDVVPLPTFNAYTRSALIQYVRTHPRQPQNVMPMLRRTALTFAMLVAALLVTGTVHAQSVLPGDTFYAWKRTSEQVWRVISFDSVATNIVLTERRLNEWIAVANDPTHSSSAMADYLEALTELESTDDVETLTIVVPALQEHQQILSNAGLSVPDLEDYIVVAEVLLPVEPLVQATPTQFPPTATEIPPTASEIPPTETDIPPTATEIPPTETEIPPTAMEIPPMEMEILPTETELQPIATEVPPTPTEGIP